jgi:type IV secretion system protein VirB6/type IV secretion system protein TrbL
MYAMKSVLLKPRLLLLAITLLLVALLAKSAFAQAKNSNIYENVLDRYHIATHEWAGTILSHATWLFWTLALISMVWTFGMMALRKADIGEFFAEFVRFIIFTGLFWWLLLNGPRFGESIIVSLRQIGGEATRLGPDLKPSAVVDIGFDVFFSAVERSTILSPLASLLTVFLGFIVLILLALVAVNMLILLVSGWVLLYGGIFFLGFGGARWTSELAINYYKTVLSVGASLFAMVLIVGIATSIIEQYYRSMTPDTHVKELAVVVIVAFTMAMLVKSIPSLISGIITGASINQPGFMGFGAGAIVGAAGMASAAVATGGAAIAVGASSVAGGTQALMAAYRKAGMSGSNNGEGLTDAMAYPTPASSSCRTSSNHDGGPLATAMGDFPTPTGGNWGKVSTAQTAASTKAKNWNNQASGDTGPDAPNRGQASGESITKENPGQLGKEPDKPEIFDKNYLAEGNTDFNFAAPEVRDFVNRSRPSS